MNKFAGHACPVCEKEFGQDSFNIAVCPECGTPHHRKCYQKTGSCFYADKHEEGFVSDIYAKETEPTRKAHDRCPECGNESFRTRSGSCAVCGINMAQENRESRPLDALGGVEIGELKIFVDKNQPYYMSNFLDIEKNKMTKFNIAAFMFTHSYFFYRKMYGLGALLFVFMIIITSPSLLIFAIRNDYILDHNIIESIMSFITATSFTISSSVPLIGGLEISYISIIHYIVMFLTGKYANRIYFNKCVSSVKFIKSTSGKNEYKQILAQKGSVNYIAAVISTVLAFIIPIMAMSYGFGIKLLA
ncbi:MAG: hypothetical protein FWH14_00820 [Oscillospiraceae bacterium]|nr:hypothetical protein [Oscillospiraceae bacterium]